MSVEALDHLFSSEQQEQLLPEGLIFLGYRGSIAHDMYVPKNDPNSIDDKDLMGIYIAPREHYMGFGRKELKEAFIGEWDVVSYELRKFMGLLLKCNPNVLSLLWLPEKHVLFEHPLGRQLRDNRHLFVSKVAYPSFTGYAMAQLKRMTHFNEEAQKEMEVLEALLQRHGLNPSSPEADQNKRDTFIAGGEYAGKRLGEMLDYYKGLSRRFYAGGYMGAKRKELVKRVGYDAKNAAHLIRLLRMGIEFLKDGSMRVARPDAEELLAIKRGEWTLDQVKAEADKLFADAERAYRESSLPAHPDHDAAERLCVELIQSHFRE
jgi:hypothetical protein